MKYSLRLAASSLFLMGAIHCFAGDPNEKDEAGFIAAKQKIENMLDGKAPLSFERAVYEMENAYLDNKLDYNNFEYLINGHVGNIDKILQAAAPKVQNNYKPDILSRTIQTADQRTAANKVLLSNWAIYSYMEDTVLQARVNGKLCRIMQQRYSYSYSDPLGTADWKNTQVDHLLRTKQGNCFALAALYKIFADRLHTDAALSTAPNHIYITHKDELGRQYNVDLSSGSFPGSGTLGTLTYTTNEAIDNNISLRQLDEKQSVALCLVYLAKGYQYRFGIKENAFMLACADAALRYDPKSLNAMLLKAEILEERLLAQSDKVAQIRNDKAFAEYETLIASLYSLGYREMPVDMKNILIKGWSRDTLATLNYKENTPSAYNHSGIANTRYASLSWGLFDEEIKNKPVEQYGRTLFDTKSKKIKGFGKVERLYNDYNFDPVAFAMQIDPLAHKFPWQSPYAAMNNNPVFYADPTGESGVASVKGDIITVRSTNIYYGNGVTAAKAKQDARNIQNTWNGANATRTIGGKTYKVQFEITGVYMKDAGKADKAREANTDVGTNYIAVGRDGEFTNTRTNTNLSDTRNLGGNEFEYNSQDLATDNQSSSHEQGHGFGWFDPTGSGDPNFATGSGHSDEDNADGSPSIMEDRNIVPQNQWGDRKAAQQDVDMLNINWDELIKTGTTNVGEDTTH